MVPEQSFFAGRMQRFSPLRTALSAFSCYLLIGTALLVFLFNTVHHRSAADIQKGSPDRYRKTMTVWIEHGYLRHAGLAFQEPVDAKPDQKVWRSSSMMFLQGAHILERVYHCATGRYSDWLMSLHNQLVVMIGAALLAMLAMCIALRIGTTPPRAFVLGAACQIVYQTFPHNLWYFWEIYPTAVVLVIAIPWLISEESGFANDAHAQRRALWRAVAVFLLILLEPVTSLFFAATYLFCVFVYSPERLKRVQVLRTIIVPAVAAAVVFAIQLAFVRIRYPRVVLEGSGFLFRTGLDGSTAYVRGPYDLLTRRWPQPGWPINSWKALFIAGAVALVLALALYIRKVPALRSSLFVISTALGLYVPFAFAFSQTASIHPYGYDIYLAMPLILVLFAILPSAIEQWNSAAGDIAFFAAALSAFCFACVQLRTYAIQFPLSP